jgi:hypothetical protein
MKKILVLVTGWHFSSHFYENMVKQILPDGWDADYFCVSHRLPNDENVIKEKESVRSWDSVGGNFLNEIDKEMYKYPITRKQIEDLGWNFMLEDNTIGDMEVFNQWSDKYDYKEYDIICITHDDNLILSDNIFYDMLDKDIKFYKPITESRYGMNNHQFKVEYVKNEDDWLFLDNGYSENIPKAFEPRGSFCFYKKELIDLLPNNKFDMSDRGKPILNRVGETGSVGYDGISVWNSAAGTFRDFLYGKLPNLGLVEKTRWFSNTKRVSKYCIEGERGFIGNYKADGQKYIKDLKNQLEEIGWI